MSAKKIIVRYPKGLFDGETCAMFLRTIQREHGVSLVDWKELPEGAAVSIDPLGSGVSEEAILRLVNLTVDDGPACGYEE